MTTVADEATTAPAKMTLPTLTAMVVGSMVGAGCFSYRLGSPDRPASPAPSSRGWSPVQAC
jgi:hypothetical protein